MRNIESRSQSSSATYPPIRAVLALVAICGIALAGTPAMAAHKKPVSSISGSITGGGRVTVHVAHTALSAKTSKSGFFTLSGRNLAGRHTLVFKKHGKTFTTSVNVPAGSKVLLQNTALDDTNGTAQPEQEDIEVVGTLTAVDCTATPNTVTITPSNGGTAVVMSFDSTTTQIVDDSTDAAISDCATLAGNYVNAPVKAQGSQGANGVVASDIELNPGQGGDNGDGGDGGDQGTSFSGTVQSENCPNSIVVQRSDGTNVTVNIATTTEIDLENNGQTPASCSNIPQGAMVKVEGTPQPDGSVNANQIDVQENGVESDGTINSTNCSATPPSISFTPNGATSAVTVTIGPTTEIEVNDNGAGACTDLTAGPAKVEGMTQPDGSIAATKIEQQGSSSGDNGGGDNGGSGNGDGSGGTGSGSDN